MHLSYVLSTQATRFAPVAFADNFEPMLARLSALGYDGVELAVRDPALLDVRALREILARYNLRVPAIGTGQAFVEEGLSFSDPDETIRSRAIFRIKSQIALARELDARVIIGLIRGGAGAFDGLPLFADAMKRIAVAAQASGVPVVIEPINRYETYLLNNVSETLACIENIGAQNLGVLFDTFHANIEEPNIEASIRACGARLLHVHIADSNRRAPGDGHLDFARVVAALREINYAGWLSAEILPKPNSEDAARQCAQTIAPLMQRGEG